MPGEVLQQRGSCVQYQVRTGPVWAMLPRTLIISPGGETHADKSAAWGMLTRAQRGAVSRLRGYGRPKNCLLLLYGCGIPMLMPR